MHDKNTSVAVTAKGLIPQQQCTICPINTEKDDKRRSEAKVKWVMLLNRPLPVISTPPSNNSE